MAFGFPLVAGNAKGIHSDERIGFWIYFKVVFIENVKVGDEDAFDEVQVANENSRSVEFVDADVASCWVRTKKGF